MRARAKATAMENEVRMFWRLMGDIKAACARGDSISDELEELDVLRRYTNSDALKARCTDAISSYGIRQNARRMRS